MVDPYDDDSITAVDRVIRRVDPEHHVVPDENTGTSRLSTKAFGESSEGSRGLSIDIKNLISEAGLVPEEYVTTPKYIGSVEFEASLPRSLGLVVGFEPIDENPYHGEIWRIGETPRFSGSQKRNLLKGSTWLVEIAGVIIPT